ncbi:MAG: 16S rRNA (cytosine(1402)-N(4))-methyltransferase RsmH [Lachnospiraceae bacterium]|nr:16S rRNA (cytosine(1402)-N(4))-methyltransferase RsmH [Lachnospiraceae bacterium]
MEFKHTSVLLNETIDALQIKPGGVYLDGTLGGGGHAYEVCKKLNEDGRFFGIDQDADAIEAAGKKLEEFGDKVTIIRNNFVNAKEALKAYGVDKVDGILLDLGVSSYQLDNAQRGFSYKYDTALDMRMDQRQQLTAKEILNNYDERELYRIIRDYGEDQFAKNIAKHIVQTRQEKPIETTFELNEIIKAAIPAKMRAVGGHPSKRTFQAIRIECNQELDVLQNALEDMLSLLNPMGRLCIITFHSLEDRIVKNFYREMENPCKCPAEFPVCVCGKVPYGRAVPRKAILPSEEELEENPRAKSAKLRVFERI